MSLKAKIEAVIYAAEEPVTLAQLAAIFSLEVPAAVHSPYADTALDASAAYTSMDALPLVHEALHEITSHEITNLDESGTMTDAVPAVPAAVDAVTAVVASGMLDTGEPASVHDAGDGEAAAKRAARLRDRQVRDHLRTLVDELISDYFVQDRGIEIREIAGGYRMATKPEYHDAVRAFVKSLKPVMKLTLQALETLAVIAYKQPVTAPEVAEIRGVDSGGVLASLMSRKLVTTAGRKQVIGRPILYKTTKEFLLRFGLKDVAELPSMEEFEKMAGELAENDALEADAMHEKAGVSAADESVDQLPFEQDAPDTAAGGINEIETVTEHVPQEQES